MQDSSAERSVLARIAGNEDAIADIKRRRLGDSDNGNEACNAEASPPLEQDAKSLLPNAFHAFCETHGVSPATYSNVNVPRYIRTNPRCPVSGAELSAELSTECRPVEWFPSSSSSTFYAIDASVKISSAPSFQSGRIYGMDLASGAAVAMLDVRPSSRVLDVCCAPGAKLCMIADIVHGGSGVVVGCDVSEPRIASCASMLKKYGLGAALVCADATAFSLPALSGQEIRAPWNVKKMVSDIRKQRRGVKKSLEQCHKSCRQWWETFVKQRIDAAAMERQEAVFDRVLVDAECTHDGSLKHLLQYNKMDEATFRMRFLDPDYLDRLEATQRSLLAAGFKQLTDGGVLVYSTCSLTQRQNEDVIRHLLATEPSAAVLPLESAVPEHAALIQHSAESAVLPGVYRFGPEQTNCGGLTVARLTKRSSS